MYNGPICVLALIKVSTTARGSKIPHLRSSPEHRSAKMSALLKMMSGDAEKGTFTFP